MILVVPIVLGLVLLTAAIIYGIAWTFGQTP